MKRSELEKIVRESLLEIEAEKNGIKKPETSDGAMTPEEEEMIKKYEEEEANKYALEKEEPLEEAETDIMAKAREIVKNYKEQEDVVAEATRIVEAWKKGKLLKESKNKDRKILKEAMDSTYTISDEVANSFRMDIAKLKKEADTKYGFSKYIEGIDYKWAIGRGDDFPNALVVLNPKMTQDPKVTKFITWVEEDEVDMTESKKKGRNILKESADPVVNKHSTGLLKALTARSKYPEDEQPYRAVEKHLKAIATELGLDASLPFMEDEMYSGKAKPEEALEYTKEMFNDWLEDSGITETKKKHSKMMNESWLDQATGILEDAANSFPSLVKKYGFEAVEAAFEIIYENTWYTAHENGADDMEAHEIAEEEILEKVEYFKKDSTDLENLISGTLAEMETDSDMTETKKKHFKMMKEATVKEITLTGDEDWDKISRLFGKEVENYDKDLLEKGKKLVKVSDRFGWDYLTQLQDGRIALPDRNTGFTNITTQPVKDVNTFVGKFMKAFEENEEGMTETKKKHYKMMNESTFKTAKEYIKAVAKDSHNVDLDSLDAEQEIKDLDINPVDIMWWMQDNDPEVGGINEEELYDYVEENDLDIKDVAEYQFREQSYDFSTGGGAGEFESTIKVQMVVDEKGKPVKIEGYDFIVSTDRGTLTGEYVLMNLKHVKFLKSIADIFNVDAGWYAGYKDRTKN